MMRNMDITGHIRNLGKQNYFNYFNWDTMVGPGTYQALVRVKAADTAGNEAELVVRNWTVDLEVSAVTNLCTRGQRKLH